LEVPSRPALTARRLNGVLAAAWARRWAALALATVVIVVAVVVNAQPVRSPWWTYADADASYTAAALNLLAGDHARFIDHPGLPVTELTALAFGADALLEERSISEDARKRYVNAALLELDDARGIFRGVAIGTYLAGALLAFFLFARLFGHWTWGFAAAILWPAAPGLVAMSIQLRPDVPLAVASLCFAYALGRAVQTRAATTYVAAGVLAGVAVMIKLHALGLGLPLLVAALWRPPDGSWRDVIARARQRPTLVAALGLPLVALALFLNGVRAPFTPTAEQTLALVGVLAAATLCVVVAAVAPRLRPVGLVGPAFVAGLLVPVALDVPDGLQALVIVAKTVLGQGVQEGVEPFARPFSDLSSIVGPRVIVFFVLAAVAGVVGLVRRDALPVVCALGASVMVVLAFARPPAVHYFAPGFALAIPAVLWLLQRSPRAPAPLLVWPVVLLFAWPSIDDREQPRIETEQFAALVQPAQRVVDRRLAQNEVALVPGNWPFADARYFDLAQRYVEDPPAYPFRYLPATEVARDFAEANGLRPRYFIGPGAQRVSGTETIDVDQYGRFSVRRLPGTDLGLVLLGPPE
jgi:hypothetical protein